MLTGSHTPPASPSVSSTRSSSRDSRYSSASERPGSCGTSPTDVESDHKPVVHAFLPTGHWADVGALRKVDATVFALVLRLPHTSVQEEAEEPRAVFVQRAVKVAEDAGFWQARMMWTEATMDVSGQSVVYYLTHHESTVPETNIINSPSSDDEPTITQAKAQRIFDQAGLHVIACITSRCSRFAVYFLECPLVSFQPLRGSLLIPAAEDLGAASQDDIRDEGGFAIDRRPYGVPTLTEWHELWAMWDLVTLRMLSHPMLHDKPIDLRHKCLFYLGHIPTFLDILLTKAIGGRPSEPASFWTIFERGIDPHVDDPDHCHSHSEVPTDDADWPSLGSVIEFRDRVRAKLVKVYDELSEGSRPLTRTLARTLVMTLEHEGFHVETLLYMLIQRAGTGTRHPPGFTSPPWTLLAEQWDAVRAPDAPMPLLGPAEVVLGRDDPEDRDLGEKAGEVIGHAFVWDNESPQRTVEVGAFRAEWRPVSNWEYLRFWEESGRSKEMPKSWVEEAGEVKVRTVYGPMPMAIAKRWPVLASYDALAEYASAKGGRMPTEPELRLFLDKYEVGYEGGANVGFRNWHPIPATTGFAHLDGRGSNGGVWEWTSTLFGGHDGFVPTKLFPGYSADFFDDKHHVVLGSSYATIPRIASRRTLRNFYQHNYPYAWVGGRVVYDV